MSHNACVVGLIEDDPVMGESLVQRLALEGITVKWWQSGRDALKDLATFKPQAIVCDIRLPDLDGEYLFRESVQTPDAPPFMFITGHGDIDQAVRLMRAGAADYITKPFEMDDFLFRLAELTRSAIGPTSSLLGISPKMQELERLLLARRQNQFDRPDLWRNRHGQGGCCALSACDLAGCDQALHGRELLGDTSQPVGERTVRA